MYQILKLRPVMTSRENQRRYKCIVMQIKPAKGDQVNSRIDFSIIHTMVDQFATTSDELLQEMIFF